MQWGKASEWHWWEESSNAQTHPLLPAPLPTIPAPHPREGTRKKEEKKIPQHGLKFINKSSEKWTK